MAPGYSVVGNAIVDNETGDPVTPGEFNEASSPEEKAHIYRELTARGLLTNQQGEGGSDLLDEEDAATEGEAPEAAPAPVTERAPLPTRDTPPSLQEFLAVAKPRNPKASTKALAQYWNDTYGHVDPKTLPTFETFLPAAKERNPQASESALRSYWDDHYGALGAQEKNPPPPGFWGTAKDLGIKGVEGVVDVAQSAVGLASLASGGKAGEILRTWGWDPEAAKAFLDSKTSEAQQTADQAVHDAKGFVDTLAAYAKNPRALAGGLAEAAPGIAAMGLAARKAATIIAEKAAAAFGGLSTAEGAAAAEKAVEAAAGKLMWVSSGTEGALSAGQIADQAQGSGREYSDYLLPSIAGGVGTAAIGRGAGKIMGGSAEIPLFTGTHAGGMTGNWTARTAKSIFSEGFLEEMPQSAQEQVFQNLAMGKPWNEGVAEAAGAGLAIGGAMGGVVGGVQRPTPPSPPPPEPPPKEKASTPSFQPVPFSPDVPFDSQPVELPPTIPPFQPTPFHPDVPFEHEPVGGSAPTIKDILRAGTIDEAIQAAGGLLDSTSAPFLNPTEKRAAFDVPLLPGSEPSQAPLIEPGLAFTPRTTPELEGRDAIAAERERLLAMKQANAERLANALEAAKQAPPGPDWASLLKTPGQAPAPVPAQPETPLASALDKSYPTVQAVRQQASDLGVNADVLNAMGKQMTGKATLDDLTPLELQNLSTRLDAIKPTQPKAKPAEAGPELLQAEPAPAPLPVSQAVKVPRHALAPEQNAQLLDAAQRADHDLTQMQGEPEQSLRDFLLSKGGLQDQGGELSHRDVDADLKPFEKKLIRENGLTLDEAAELAHEAGLIPERDLNALLEAIDREHRGLDNTADWYREATTGKNKLTRERVDIAVAKIIADKGRDVGKDVERIKAILLQDQTFTQSPHVPQTDTEWSNLVHAATPSQPAPLESGSMPERPPILGPESQAPAPTTETAPLDATTDEERDQALFDEAQTLMRRLPNNIGKAKQEGRLSKKQLQYLERLDEIERLLPNTSERWKRLYDKARAASDASHQSNIATFKAEQLDRLKASGFSLGDSVEFFAQSMLGVFGGGQMYRGVIIQTPNGSIRVRDKSGRTYAFFENAWRAAKEEPSTGVQSERDKLEGMRKPKPGQQEIHVPPPTSGERPIIGREPAPGEAPLFSPSAQVPDVEQSGLSFDAPAEPEQKQPSQADTIKQLLSGRDGKLPEVQKPQPSESAYVQAVTAIAQMVEGQLRNKGIITTEWLLKHADTQFGGTRAEGKYTEKDAYEALELGVNKYILHELSKQVPADSFTSEASITKARVTYKAIHESILQRLPTQRPARTEEQNEFQQFSTIPDLAYVMNYAAAMRPTDVMLEPSAGLGGLASFAKLAGATVYVNEYNDRRAALLKTMGFDRVFTENAEQLNNILPDDVKPTVIVMNPPFSSTAGRMEGQRDSRNVLRHLDQALARLQPGGRLVALIGMGRNGKDPQYLEEWIDQTAAKYAYRARIRLSGEGYKKYGTKYDNQFLVFDKIAPDGTTPVITPTLATSFEALNLLTEVRNVRPVTDQPAPTQSGSPSAPAGRPSRPDQRPALPPAADVVGTGAGEARPGPASRPGSSRPSGANSHGVAGQSGQGGGAAVSSAGNGQPEGKPATESPNPAGSQDAGGRGLSSPGQPGESGERRPEPGPELPERVSLAAADETPAPVPEQADAIFETYRPKKVQIAGAQAHPGKLVESSAMAAVDPPAATYRPTLPKDVIDGGRMSLPQLESTVYAGQAHEQFLPDGSRQGFFDGDGTGVGKGREIAGIILDNWMQGRKKAVWLSKGANLYASAVRDWQAVAGKDRKEVFSQGDLELNAKIEQKEGVLFTYYSLIGSGLDLSPEGALETKKDEKGNQAPQTRFSQLRDWLGKDFDGVIVFDEAHEMRNNMTTEGARGDKKPAMKALAGVELQKLFPKARIAYFSATGGIEVSDFGYAERLGMWGPGTAFPNKQAFVGGIEAGGMAAMEVVAQDLKANGLYLSRSLSYDDVTYERLTHELTPVQREQYDALARGWQIIIRNIRAALEATGANNNGRAKGAAYSALWGAQLRFFDQILVTMQMPTVLAKMKKDLEAGHAVVVQLTKTNEAGLKNEIKAKKAEGASLDDLDLTPRQMMLGYLRASFPVQEYETFIDENGNVRSRPVTDSAGRPVENKEAVAMRDDLIEELGMLKFPDPAMEQIINAFGYEHVAEVTGRNVRVVKQVQDDGTIKAIEQKRSKAITQKEAQEFMDDKRSILIFSDAGGTGQSYHADLAAKNQRRRMHYVLQPGWRADAAMQGLGRTHRTNQASAPHYMLTSTDLNGHKRFISTIARRLAQLGALTKGQRQTTSQGLFSERDNLENAYAAGAIKAFFVDLRRGAAGRFGWSDLIDKMGLDEGKLLDKNGNLVDAELPDVPKFLNRLLTLEYADQNDAFDLFMARMDRAIELAKANGTFQTGLENYRHDGATVAHEQTVYTDPRTKATTKLVQFTAHHKINYLPYQGAAHKDRFQGFYIGSKTGKIYAAYAGYQHTKEDGEVEEQIKLQEPDVKKHRLVSLKTFRDNYVKVTGDAETKWKEAIAKAPAKDTETVRLLSGALLRIWDRLPKTHTRVLRVVADDGRRVVGRLIPDHELDLTLERLDVKGEKEEVTVDKMLAAIEDGGNVELVNGWKIGSRTVNGEERLELYGNNLGPFRNELKAAGLFTESIRFETRFFIPLDRAKEIVEKLTQHRPVLKINRKGRGGSANNQRETVNEPEAAYGLTKAPAFYSTLERTIAHKMPNKVRFDQAKSLLVNAGVKPDELKWTGLDDYLKTKETFTKQDLLDFVREHSVQVQEVMKGESRERTELQKRLNELASLGGDRTPEEESEYDKIANRLQHGQTFGGEPKFSSYQLPGGTDYRELLLTLPPQHQSLLERYHAAIKANAPQADLDRMSEELAGKRSPAFTSSHFSEPNILAHVRFNTRMVDGKKVLFLEEVQSDWHQAGRKNGYKTGAEQRFESLKRSIEDKYKKSLIDIRDDRRRDEHRTEQTLEVKKDLAAIDAAYAEAQAEKHNGGPPDAPFKKTWHELVLKKMLRYAAENGFDSLAWTTGAQQAERYDLSKQIDKIEYAKSESGSGYIVNVFKGGHDITNGLRLDRDIPASELADVLGKDITDKIVNGEGKRQSYVAFRPDNPYRSLSGLDLRVGGDGMRSFYDAIIPQFLQKYGKKWGAQVGTLNLRVTDKDQRHIEQDHPPTKSETVHSLPITEAMRKSVLTEGQALFDNGAKYEVRQGEQQSLNYALGQAALGDLDRTRVLSSTDRNLSRTGAPARTVALSITPDLIHDGVIDLTGYQVQSAEDVAKLAQVYRDPRFETFRIIYTKGTEIVGHEGLTSRMPGFVLVFKNKEDAASKLAAMQERMDALGATGYYILHNHPSGNSTPSQEDFKITERFAMNLPGFKGHVIIDSNQYDTITFNDFDDLEGKKHQLDLGPDKLLTPAIPHPLLGSPLSTPEEVAAVGRKIQSKPDYATVIYRSGGRTGATRAIQEVAVDFMADPAQAGPYLREQAVAFGASQVFVHYGFSRNAKEEDLARSMDGLIADGTVMDYVTSGIEGSIPTSQFQFGAVKTPGMVFGQHMNDIESERVAEEGPSAYASGRIIGDAGRDYTPAQRQAMARTGSMVTPKTIKDTVRELWKDAGKKLAQGLVDQFSPVRDLSSHAYALLRLSKSAAGAFEAFLHHGKLSLKDGAYDADTTGGVIATVFTPLGRESTDFLRWIAGNRAERLQKEGKEHLFTDEDIAAFKSLADDTTDFDYTLPDGTVTRDRTLIYADSLKKFNEFNKNVLDIAEASGLIDGESRHLWEHEFYVPFYRTAEEQDGGVRGMNIKSGVIRQEAFKQLKGGEQQLNDLLANTLLNWSHLIDASAKNRAAKATLDAAEAAGVAHKAVPGAKKIAWYMGTVNGQHGKVEYTVKDPYLLDAISSLEYAGLRGPAMDGLSAMKHWLTVGVTASPFFKVRNLIRDSVQAIATADLGYNPVANIIKGAKLTDRTAQEYVSALAGGGLIRFGTMLEGSDAKRVRQLIKQGTKDPHMLDGEGKMRAFYDKYIEPSIMAYNELGNRGEEINRMTLYDRLITQGVDHATASLMARDLMDFSMQGTWTSIRLLTQVVPFMNARLQGLYKLGRAAREDKARFAIVLGSVALASLSLLAAYQDDDDWKKREDWDRDNYWWFKFAGEAFRIPKPFEIGAIATLAERSAELLTDKEMTGARFRSVIAELSSNQLAMNPIPQAVKPIIDLYANYDSFTGRPIETMGMERLAPEHRFRQGTSMVARGLSTAGNAVTGGRFPSPVQIDHISRAYFGWLGSFVVGSADLLLRGVSQEPTRPTLDYWKLATGGMVAGVEGAQSRYVSQMYAQAQELEQAYATWRHLAKEGKSEEARDYLEAHRDELTRYKSVEAVKSQSSKLNERIRMIERSAMSPDAKREKINALRSQQDRLARMLVPR